jgi:hypothetical protein
MLGGLSTRRYPAIKKPTNKRLIKQTKATRAA